MYFKGIGVTRSDEEAYFWIQLSMPRLEAGESQQSARDMTSILDRRISSEERAEILKRIHAWKATPEMEYRSDAEKIPP